ncbi:L-aspartate oxidase [Fischerella thermalis]|uniref:L-aspartate oxidase n=2 Tax=Fischerella TaxID=1190 RepID=G6FRF7_9CYAN|nr:L-aspartate oxidase [Fischerella thermalis]EHC16031.1 L-aspartate oxidase [Fischerella thermalis JSC-11]PLZ05321.1 L-aspartate oxidase [Fischerella thermalis WC1110]PLZ08620.1 L-aspartate oxidase [Fischerella thermalis WC114]PLZ14103.1 L-aspartate oxidase [Fischerella thermalis WC119]PLZ18059.1 L-aspartate oxidase [Fischerella thermalis WC341]PLZ18984.1 L-aspartate oxidase [Fischerella thermalis WC157]PLZ26335.1 L-aspartate oxidase [Fischerella thermalis WC558]PLZ30686.1 L-aspartate oxid
MLQIDIFNQFDVLVVGAGAAGLYTALCLPQSLQVGLITKETLTLSASDWAQGGIAAAIAPDDSPRLHIEDTIKAGAGLCDRPAVEFLAEHAPDCIKSLVELGVAFDRHDNHLALTLEAAHSKHRVLHAADTTGREVITTLTAQVLQRKNIQVIQQALALSLWIDPQTQTCQGISLFYQGEITWIKAGAVVLATGGGGQVFAQTTNPAVSTGDGVAIAARAGAILRDLEFVQFHPTALTKPGAERFLISEAVRGEGAHLIDNEGRRFAFDYHPAGELAPRDIVSRAIFSHLQKTTADPATAHVWLDMRPIPADKIRHRFPNIIHVCQRWGIDVFSEPIPVAPAAHYWMGGILTDMMNRTNIPGLYAVGETASTGVHGANRLASNSLLECIVFGAQMAHLELKSESVSEEPLPTVWEFVTDLDNWHKQRAYLEDLRQKIPRLVWQYAGICREQSGLEIAIATVKSWQQDFADLQLSQFLLCLHPKQSVSFKLPDVERQLRLWAETHNLLDVAYLILTSAAFRKESRGGHYRLDYPQSDPNWQVHTLVQYYNWWKAPVLT